MNNAVIVGKVFRMGEVVSDLETQEIRYLDIDVSVLDYDNPDTHHIIPCRLLGNVAKNFKEYCVVDDMVGVKGKLKKVVKDYNVDNTELELKLVADKLTFLSSKKTEDLGNNNEE